METIISKNTDETEGSEGCLNWESVKPEVYMTSIISRIAVRLNMETTVHGKDGSIMEREWSATNYPMKVKMLLQYFKESRKLRKDLWS